MTALHSQRLEAERVIFQQQLRSALAELDAKEGQVRRVSAIHAQVLLTQRRPRMNAISKVAAASSVRWLSYAETDCFLSLVLCPQAQALQRDNSALAAQLEDCQQQLQESEHQTRDTQLQLDASEAQCISHAEELQQLQATLPAQVCGFQRGCTSGLPSSWHTAWHFTGLQAMRPLWTHISSSSAVRCLPGYICLLH